jgi:hypothetical protein
MPTTDDLPPDPSDGAGEADAPVDDWGTGIPEEAYLVSDEPQDPGLGDPGPEPDESGPEETEEPEEPQEPGPEDPGPEPDASDPEQTEEPEPEVAEDPDRQSGEDGEEPDDAAAEGDTGVVDGDEVAGDGEDEVLPPEALEPQPVTGVVRGLWFAAITLLVVATVLAVIPPLRRGIPIVGGAIDSAYDWTGGAAGDAAAGVAGFWRDSSESLQRMAEEIPDRQIEQQRRLEGSESLLVVATDDGGSSVFVALLSRSPEGESAMVVIPPGLFAILPGYGDFRLAQATVFEGPELTALTLTNLLGVRIDDILHLGPGDIAAAVGRPLIIDLPNPLMVAAGDGTEAVVAASGSAVREADGIEVIVTTRGTGDQFEWMQRQVAAWGVLFAEMSTDPALPERFAAHSTDPTAVTGLLAAAAPDITVTVLPASPVSGTGNVEGFVLSFSAADAFVTQRIAHLRIREGERPRVEILNGNGRVLTTRTVAESLVRRGFLVIKTDNADQFDYETTLVIAQGREHQREAEEVVNLLGSGDLLLELRAPSGVVDLSIIVGLDIPAGEG